MDLNRKIRALEDADDKENQIFNRTIKLQKQVMELKDKITKNSEQFALMNNRLKQFDLEIFKSEYEVNVLEIHQKQMDQYIKTKLAGIMDKEEELKQLKLKFTQNMNEAMDNLKSTVQYLHLIDNSVNKQEVQNEKIMKNEMRRLEGELDALKIYQNYQNMRLKEIEDINIVLNQVQIVKDNWEMHD